MPGGNTRTRRQGSLKWVAFARKNETEGETLETHPGPDSRVFQNAVGGADHSVPAAVIVSNGHNAADALRGIAPVILFPLSFSVLFAIGLMLAIGVGPAVAALAGGLISVIPNAFLAGRMVAAAASGEPKRMLSAAYVGEIIKFLLTMGLLVWALLSFGPATVGYVIAGFIVAKASIWAAMIYVGKTGAGGAGNAV